MSVDQESKKQIGGSNVSFSSQGIPQHTGEQEALKNWVKQSPNWKTAYRRGNPHKVGKHLEEPGRES